MATSFKTLDRKDIAMFQSIFDYPHLSSSANHLFDLTVGYSTASTWATGQPIPDGDNTQNTEKLNIYNQMAQVLVGHDHTGSIKEFKIPGGDTIREAYFINFSRLLENALRSKPVIS